MMSGVGEKLVHLWPEMALLVGAVLTAAAGLCTRRRCRALPACLAAVSLGVSGALVLIQIGGLPQLGGGLAGLNLVHYVRLLVVGLGLLLVLVTVNAAEAWSGSEQADRQVGSGRIGGLEQRSGSQVSDHRGEFFAFFLMSLMGVMLVAGAEDLVWLFLALELVSLPTYVMIAISRRPQESSAAWEAAVKYFFLGALSVAIFLYGFALIYGASGSTRLEEIRQLVRRTGPENVPLLLNVGLALAVVGLSFKIAAVPMHFYVADVYQGASAAVSAFLAVVPKTAGFVALVLVLGVLDVDGGARIPGVLGVVLWILAVLSMTVGNTLALLQRSVRRVLAYSSVAHSGYMLVGLLAGVNLSVEQGMLGNGLGGVLFYLMAYGLGVTAAFAVLGSLEHAGWEADDYRAISGLARRSGPLALSMLLAMLSLIGLPPMVGFVGKVYLFGSAVQAGYMALVVVAVLNSAISAVYYLRIAGACYFGAAQEAVEIAAVPSRRVAGMIAGIAAVLLGLLGGPLVEAAGVAAQRRPAAVQTVHMLVRAAEKLQP